VGTSENRRRPGVSKGFTIERNPRFHEPLVLNFARLLQGFDDELRFIHVQPLIRQILSLVQSQEFKDAAGAHDRELLNNVIMPFLDASARQQVGKPGQFRLVDGFLKALRGVGGLIILGGKAVTTAVQITGLVNIRTQVKRKYWRQAGQSMILQPHSTVRMFMDRAGSRMTERFRIQMQKLQQDLQRLTKQPFWRERQLVINIAGRAMFFPLRAVQTVVDIISWHAAYAQFHGEVDRAGMTPEQFDKLAIQEAGMSVERSQGSNFAESLAAYETQAQPLTRLWSQFGSYSNTVLNQILGSQPGWERVRAVGWTLLLVPIVEETIRSILKGPPDDDDRDGEMWDEWAERFAVAVARNVAGLIPGAGPALMTVAEGEGDRLASSPAATVLTGAWNGATAAWDLVAGDEDSTSAYDVRNIATLLTIVTGLPFNPLASAWGYQMEVNSGDVRPSSAFDHLRGLLTGRPAEGTRR
jgi:hypothetical protein